MATSLNGGPPIAFGAWFSRLALQRGVNAGVVLDGSAFASSWVVHTGSAVLPFAVMALFALRRPQRRLQPFDLGEEPTKMHMALCRRS